MRKRKTNPCLCKAGVLVAALSLLGLIACEEAGDSFSRNPNHTLSFSVDTLSFDTVFTAVGSATRQFMIYNRNNKDALKIESVRLASGGTSGFRFNIDGRNGNSFSDILILNKDSMYVFVEVTVDPTGNNLPLWIEDYLEFVVHGAKQSVLLRACGQDVHLLKNGTAIAQDTLWTADRPYLIYDSITVEKGYTLTIEKGATLYMHDKAKWIINGTLRAEGTLEAPITFRGDRLDDLLTDVPYDRIPNQWDGIYYGAESFDNIMDHTIVRNGRSGLCFSESVAHRSKIIIRSSQIVNMEESVLRAVNCNIEAANTEFANAAGQVISLAGGVYRFVHCTVANYFVFSPGRSGSPALTLANYTLPAGQEKTAMPLEEAVFDNCIIDGSFSEGSETLGGEITIDRLDGVDLNFLFNHCAVKTKEIQELSFVEVQFIRKDFTPQYKSIGDEENHYVFDFRPVLRKDNDGKPLDNQVAIGKADALVAAKYPLDRLGINRLTSEDGPDMGAYEYVPEPEEEP
ncbi:MAG: hypothetical protein MdMp024_0254 [Bacteroidales bacterium]